jgi:hypothetical protein
VAPNPTGVLAVLNGTVLSGLVLLFEHVTEHDAIVRFASNRKANRIILRFCRPAGTRTGIAQIAAFTKLVLAGNFAFVTGSGATSGPTVSQWQSSRMHPSAV